MHVNLVFYQEEREEEVRIMGTHFFTRETSSDLVFLAAGGYLGGHSGKFECTDGFMLD